MVYPDYNVTPHLDEMVAKAMIPIFAVDSEHNNGISLRQRQKNRIGKIANIILKNVKKTGLASQNFDPLIEVSNTKSG